MYLGEYTTKIKDDTWETELVSTSVAYTKFSLIA